jgi:hypothetical protein
MANLYWAQGDRDMALGIIDGILASDPRNERALEWRALRNVPAATPEPSAEGALTAFLDRITKEYGHGIPRNH